MSITSLLTSTIIMIFIEKLKLKKSPVKIMVFIIFNVKGLVTLSMNVPSECLVINEEVVVLMKGIRSKDNFY